MEFLCTTQDGRVQLKLNSDACKRFLSSMQRKWKVMKIYLNHEGPVKVEHWAVSSAITYTGNMGMFSFQALELFFILLYDSPNWCAVLCFVFAFPQK